jgi:RNA-directed DNA polymerase
MEEVVDRENMMKAWKKVKGNKGVPGVDGMPVEELPEYLKLNWAVIKESLLNGDYQPSPVKGVEIPKPGGGKRQLGIPTVLDRQIQQALHQKLNPIFDPDFSESSYGFREGRSAHKAVLAARQYVSEGRRWVVDMDLEKFFDRVNHDVLMALVARKVEDKRVLGLIRRYLQAGLMVGGVASARTEGTPQGGPLSPLLSNILLDELDKELEKRGHCFCRYADDCNIYVRSRRSGERVMESIKCFLSVKLKLKVNEAKSAVARPWERKFLGYSMTWHKRPRLKIAAPVLKRLKGDIRRLCAKARGWKMANTVKELTKKLRGFGAYFRLAEVKGALEEVDQWVRRKLRAIKWRQWKRPRTRARELMRKGLAEERAGKSAYNGRGPWWNAGASHMNQALPLKYFESLGLVSLLQTVKRFQCNT